MSDNEVTCDFLVPLTVRVDVETGQALEVWLHLESFQSSLPGRFIQEHGENLHVMLRNAFVDGHYFADGDDPIGDKALAIADRVTINEPEFPLRFTQDEES